MTEKSNPAARAMNGGRDFKGAGIIKLCLVAAFFVSPLLFFTDLTRNPYYFQITLLNAAVLIAVLTVALNALRGDGAFPSASALKAPGLALLGVYAASFAYSYYNHQPFFRPAIASEGLKTALYTLVNCVFVFFLSRRTPFVGEGRLEEAGTGKWLALMLGWGALWILFPFLKTAGAGQDFWSRFWNPYGGLLWLTGAAAAYFTLRKDPRQEDILSMIMAAAGLASLYGVLQYFHVEFVWAKLINPYGNRSVSTFGNPNFISSYVVMLLPLAAYYVMGAETFRAKLFYGLLFFSYEAMLMASLTRSSWIGAAAGLVFLFSIAGIRRRFMANKKFLVPFFSAAMVLLVFWPGPSLKPLSSGLIERISEAADNIDPASSFSLGAAPENIYGSLHQRLLIWTGAWQMGLENPLLGKGWGLFELFYPFYQGNLMFHYEPARGLRTHANNAHNELLEQWSQAGLLGLGAYIWFFVTLGAGFYFYQRRLGPEAAACAAPFAAALLGMLVDNMLNVSLHFAVPGLLFWWLAGALSLKVFCEAAKASPAAPQQALSRAGKAGAALLIIFCLLTCLFWQRQFAREFYYFSGFKEMRRSHFALAALELKKAYDWHPREVNNNYELANAYVRSGEIAKAQWAYGEALKANTGYDEVYFNLAVVQKRSQDVSGARRSLETSAYINPLTLSVYQALAEVYIASGSALCGIRTFSDAVKIFPGDGNLWNTLGYFYSLNKDMPRSREAYGRGVRCAPENKMLRVNLEGVSAAMKLRSDPDLRWLSLYEQASAAFAAGDIKKAVVAAGELLKMEPENASAMALNARLLFKTRDFAGARRLLSDLLRKNPADVSSRYGLAVIYENEGDLAGARAEWQNLLRYDPGNATALARIKAVP